MSELEWDWDVDVLSNLNRLLGIDLRYMLGVPEHTISGERVMFLLRGGTKAALEIAEEIANRSRVAVPPNQPTGYPHVALLDELPMQGPPPEKIMLRTTDLLGELAFWRGQRVFIQSRSLWPDKEPAVRWLLGTLFMADRRVLAYADLRQPKAKLIFLDSFFAGSDAEENRSRRVSHLLERLQGALTLKNRYVRHDAYQWAKIVNVCDGPQWLSLLDNKGNLTVEQVPYADW